MVINSSAPDDVKAAVLADFFVICSVTGERIPLPDVKYWNVERQIAYVSAEVVPEAHFYPHMVSITLETTTEQT